MGKQWKQWQTLFSWTLKSLQMVTVAMKLKDAPWKKSYDQPRQHIKKQRHYLTDKGPSSQSYGFSSSRVWMWELDYKSSWTLMNWCCWTVVLEKTLESPLDCKEIQPVNPMDWIFIGKTDGPAEAPTLWPHDAKNWLIGKDQWWVRLRAGGEGDDRGWNGWMASSTQGTWVWANSGRQWRTGKPGVLQFMGWQSQTRLSDWTTKHYTASTRASQTVNCIQTSWALC